MRIIKRGERTEDKKYRVICNKCHTVFEFQHREAEYHTDRGEAVLIVKCPVCKNRVGVKP